MRQFNKSETGKSKLNLKSKLKSIKKKEWHNIERIILDKNAKNAIYVAFNRDGLLGMSGKLFSLPWSMMK